MSPIIPFQIVVGGRAAGGSYLLRAAAAGRTAESTLELPPLRGGPEELGPSLGRALFPPALRRLLVDTARGADAAGARVQLQLQIAPPEVAAAPWEWLTLGSTTLWQPALRDDYPLVRVGWRVRPTPAVGFDGPLRMLIAAAPGMEAAVAVLGHALTEAVRAEVLVVDLLRDATPEDLRDALAEEPCHLLHLIAPVDSRPRGVPLLGLGRGLDPAGLAEMLQNQPGLRLISIADPSGDEDAVARLAHSMHEEAERAIIALGGIDAAQAALFCGPCYTALAAGDPVDLAVTDGRAALAAADAAWGAPQLRIAAGGEQLFRPQPHIDLRREASAGQHSAPLGEPVVPAWRPERPAPPRPITSTFAVRSTTVGEPTRRPRSAPSNLLPDLRLIALLAASLLLVFMIVQVNSRPTPTPTLSPDAAEAFTALGDSASTLALPIATEPLLLPVPELIPLAQREAQAAIIADLERGPLRAPAPQSHAAYVTVEGDTLASIAQRAGSDLLAIAAYNRLDPYAPLRAGRPLIVPIYTPAEALPSAPVIARGNPALPRVALTFDIEIDDVMVYSILDVLDQRGVKGTFFVAGRWVEVFPEAARAIVQRGHEIANHSFSHPSFATLDVDAAVAELERTEQIVREVTGATTRPYFRLPYGDAPPATIEALGRQGYAAYAWSTDDNGMPGWLAQAAAEPSSAYGGIILLHGRAGTIAALPDWLDQLAAAGLQPTTLSATLE